MLNEHTLDQLRSLRLDGMVRAIEEQATGTATAGLSFDERLTLLVQREIDWRDGKRLRPRDVELRIVGDRLLDRRHAFAERAVRRRRDAEARGRGRCHRRRRADHQARQPHHP